MLYSQFYLYESGTVYIDFKPNGSDSGRLTVRWKDKNGVTGEYSAEDHSELEQEKQPLYDPEYYIDENGEELPSKCNVDYCYADDEIREKLGTRDGITLDTGVKELPDSSLVDADAYLDMLDVHEKEIYVLFRDLENDEPTSPYTMRVGYIIYCIGALINDDIFLCLSLSRTTFGQL